MKKQLVMALALLLTFGMFGCGQPQDTQEQPQEKQIWLLESQVSYDGYDSLAMKTLNHYNEDGYVVYSESDFYEFGEYTDEINFTYEYTGEETEDGALVCIVTMDRGDAPYYEPWEAEPYSVDMTREMYPGWENIGNICTAIRAAEELENGTILKNWNEDPYEEPQFDYAEYTFDEWGNPIKVVTYGSDGTVLGTTESVWRLYEPAA